MKILDYLFKRPDSYDLPKKTAAGVRPPRPSLKDLLKVNKIVKLPIAKY